MNEAIVFDTHRFVRNLTASGFTERQAEALANEQVQLLNANLATKADIAAVQADVERVRSDLEAKLAAVQADLEVKIAECAVQPRSEAGEPRREDREQQVRHVEVDVRRPHRPERHHRHANHAVHVAFTTPLIPTHLLPSFLRRQESIPPEHSPPS